MLCVFVCGCVNDDGRDPETGMKMNLTAGKDLSAEGYVQNLDSASGSSDFQYKVTFELTNNGNTPVEYDEMLVIFHNGQRDLSNSIMLGEDIQPTVISEGQTLTYDFYSGPGTNDFIYDSVNGRIGFSVMLIQDVGENKRDVIFGESAILPIITENRFGKEVELEPLQIAILSFTDRNTDITNITSAKY